MKRRRSSSVSAGHDAFLDIVANLVGILIILVVVLGAQSQATLREARDRAETEVDPSRLAAKDEDLSELALTATRAAAAQADSIRLEKTIKVLDAQIAKQSDQRTALMLLLEEAKAAWEEDQLQLDEEQRLAAERDAEASRLNKQLAEARSAAERLSNVETPTSAVEHLPTPMAKTVLWQRSVLPASCRPTLCASGRQTL